MNETATYVIERFCTTERCALVRTLSKHYSCNTVSAKHHGGCKCKASWGKFQFMLRPIVGF